MTSAGADGLRLYDRNKSKWSQASPYYAFEGLESKDEYFLVYTRNRLWQKRACSGELEPVALPPDVELFDVAVGPGNGIWATTDQGGIHLADGESEWKPFSGALPEGELGSISVDPNGTIWVRVRGKGMFAGDQY